jgi:hypothetical protein
MKTRNTVQREKIASRCALAVFRGRWGRGNLRRAAVSRMPSFCLSDKERMNECGVLVNWNDSRKPKRSKRNLSWFQSDPEIPHGCTCDWLRASAVRSRRIIVCVTVQQQRACISDGPFIYFYVSYLILSLETSINVWLRIHFFVDMIILRFARRNLSCRK